MGFHVRIVLCGESELCGLYQVLLRITETTNTETANTETANTGTATTGTANTETAYYSNCLWGGYDQKAP